MEWNGGGFIEIEIDWTTNSNQLAIGNWQLAIGRTHVILFLFDLVFEIKVNDLKLMLVGPS